MCMCVRVWGGGVCACVRVRVRAYAGVCVCASGLPLGSGVFSPLIPRIVEDRAVSGVCANSSSRGECCCSAGDRQLPTAAMAPSSPLGAERDVACDMLCRAASRRPTNVADAALRYEYSYPADDSPAAPSNDDDGIDADADDDACALSLPRAPAHGTERKHYVDVSAR